MLVLFSGFQLFQFCFFLLKVCVSGLLFFLFVCFCFGFWVCDDAMYENIVTLFLFLSHIELSDLFNN